MEIRCEPYNLNITSDINNCPKCTSGLNKVIRDGNYLISECGYCRYSDRPFASCGSSLQNHFPEGCTCNYGIKQYIYYICENCKNPKCQQCNSNIREQEFKEYYSCIDVKLFDGTTH